MPQNLKRKKNENCFRLRLRNSQTRNVANLKSASFLFGKDGELKISIVIVSLTLEKLFLQLNNVIIYVRKHKEWQHFYSCKMHGKEESSNY
jgi:hypothetical protein